MHSTRAIPALPAWARARVRKRTRTRTDSFPRAHCNGLIVEQSVEVNVQHCASEPCEEDDQSFPGPGVRGLVRGTSHDDLVAWVALVLALHLVPLPTGLR